MRSNVAPSPHCMECLLWRPSLKGSPTPPNVGVEKVPNVVSVHLTGSGAMAVPDLHMERGA